MQEPRGVFEANVDLHGGCATGNIIARGLNDSNVRWFAIGAFIVLTGFGFNQWVNGIVRIIEAFRTL